MTWPTRRGPWPLTRSWPPSSPKVVAASHRSGRSARRAGAREARFVHVVDLARQSRAIVFAWWNPCTSIRPCCAADGGTGGELRGRASLVTVDVLTGHICSISFCLYVPTERDKYVWLVQSRRRPEKWTRTRRAGSRGSATPDPVS